MRYVTLIFALIVLSAAILSADEKKLTPAKKRPTLDESVQRAFAKARNIGDQKLTRVTVVTNDTSDETMAVMFCEFGSGDLGMFQGGRDASEDMWILVEKRNLDLMGEVTKRSLGK